MSTTVVVHDGMQEGYTYVRTAPVGKNFDPLFTPDLTPQEMLELGVFGGVYLRDCVHEFPAAWFRRAKFQVPGVFEHDPRLNYFGVSASQPRSVWLANGWIVADDPRGWFQWYCRYYMGRRMPQEDERQIRRWRAMRRHIAQLRRACAPRDLFCRRRQRQALLHWAYDSRNL